MARAITGIDEELIDDAHTVQKARVIPWGKLCTLAAGFVLIALAAFLLRPGQEARITVLGQELTAQAVSAGQEDLSAVPRAYSLEPVNIFTVPMEIEVAGPTAITALGGTMQVFDREGNSLLYEGEAFDTEDDVLVFWTVEADGTSARFEMSVKCGRTEDVVVLAYDGGEGWKIRKAGK